MGNIISTHFLVVLGGEVDFTSRVEFEALRYEAK
jgi:hypothetical protein